MPEPGDREIREVRSDDPSLSADANARLTEELREVVGSDTVEVPAGATDTAHERHGGHNQLLDLIIENRYAFVSLAAIAIVVGAVIALLTGAWWVILIAVALDIFGFLVVGASIFQMTTETEHPSPTLAAELEDEGVPDPDHTFTELVDEFGGPAREPGAEQS